MGQKPGHLYELLVALTGDDGDGIRVELDRLIAKLGLTRETLTENDVRRLVGLYLEEIHVENEIEGLDASGALKDAVIGDDLLTAAKIEA